MFTPELIIHDPRLPSESDPSNRGRKHQLQAVPFFVRMSHSGGRTGYDDWVKSQPDVKRWLLAEMPTSLLGVEMPLFADLIASLAGDHLALIRRTLSTTEKTNPLIQIADKHSVHDAWLILHYRKDKSVIDEILSVAQPDGEWSEWVFCTGGRELIDLTPPNPETTGYSYTVLDQTFQLDPVENYIFCDFDGGEPIVYVEKRPDRFDSVIDALGDAGFIKFPLLVEGENNRITMCWQESDFPRNIDLSGSGSPRLVGWDAHAQRVRFDRYGKQLCARVEQRTTDVNAATSALCRFLTGTVGETRVVEVGTASDFDNAMASIARHYFELPITSWERRRLRKQPRPKL